MDNLTHSLVGFAAAKAGLERLSPYATPLCVVAANAPDGDLITALAGSSTYLREHRGVSHSIIGVLALAIVLALATYAVASLIARWRRQPNRARLGGLLLVSLIVSATHPLLDWTNNYGVRPLLPWNSQWYYGDLVFIIDPWLWLSLGGACFLLTARTGKRLAAWTLLGIVLTVALFALPGRAGISYPLFSKIVWLGGIAGLVVAYRARVGERRWRGGIAVAALAGILVYWGVLSLLHQRALRVVENAMRVAVIDNSAGTTRYAAMPTLGHPWRWRAVVDTTGETYRFDLNLLIPGGMLEKGGFETFIKPAGQQAATVDAARNDPRATAFLEFSRFPAISIRRHCSEALLVQFTDLRFSEPDNNTEDNSFKVNVVVEGGRPPEE